LGVLAQALAAGLPGGLCEERQGLPGAGRSWSQPVPAGSSGPTAEHG